MPTRRERFVKPIQSLLLHKRIWASRAASRDELSTFFDLVAPRRTEHQLLRIGGHGDGGYLLPDDLSGIEACFSPGVAGVSDFELAIANRGIPCFLADYSVDAPPIQHRLFHFEKRYLGDITDATYMTLQDWVGRHTPRARDLLLQMDIEGSEYAVILDAAEELLARFRILAIEFHDLDDVFGAAGNRLINMTFQKLLRQFDIVHIHPNNDCAPVVSGEFSVPPVMEFTFLRKDRSQVRQHADHFPHELDRANIDTAADFPLPRCWYRREHR